MLNIRQHKTDPQLQKKCLIRKWTAIISITKPITEHSLMTGRAHWWLFRTTALLWWCVRTSAMIYIYIYIYIMLDTCSAWNQFLPGNKVHKVTSSWSIHHFEIWTNNIYGSTRKIHCVSNKLGVVHGGDDHQKSVVNVNLQCRNWCRD